MIAALVAAAGLVSGLAVLIGTGSWRTALRVLLDLLTAAGLLRLGVDQGWTELAGAAAIIGLRRVLWSVLAAGPRAPLFRRSGGGNDHGWTVLREPGESGRITA
ncbi:hypothetical protein [Micromonospora mirobrigensis]|uniref:DUF1622 domain-containing protein n=1 Tax=Micromonospora mirobrigensis TaxID=262898 RepID=A0A1C4WFU3_9ACTN|nr:hypothetical protein [Micromonospora mirobrigensis]SCE95050.1 hypothetical protein GA0070564_102236 [Micromonospora mirobrigensis]